MQTTLIMGAISLSKARAGRRSGCLAKAVSTQRPPPLSQLAAVHAEPWQSPDMKFTVTQQTLSRELAAGGD